MADDIMKRVTGIRRAVSEREQDRARAQAALAHEEGKLAAAEEELAEVFGVTDPGQYAAKDAELTAAVTQEAARIEGLLAAAGAGDA